MSNSSPIPVPITCTSSWISALESTLSIRFFSELMIFPRSGRIAWFDLSRASLAAPPAEVARLARRHPRACCRDRLLDDLLRVLRVLLEELRQLRVHGLLDEALHPRVAALRLRLALELRVGQLDRDDRCEPLAHVLAFE